MAASHAAPGYPWSRGTRIVIDSNESTAIFGDFLVCANGGCIAQLETNADFIAALKQGQYLQIEAYNMQQTPTRLSLPLADFSQDYTGPPIDEKTVQVEQRTRQEELDRRGPMRREPLPPTMPRRIPGSQ